MGYRVGVDIGGSFTDFAVFDEATRALTTSKCSPARTNQAPRCRCHVPVRQEPGNAGCC